MPNTFDQRELLERLNMDIDAELMQNDLNDILEWELSKPAAEVDTQLVEELLDLLNAEEPTEAEKEACWQGIVQRMKMPPPEGGRFEELPCDISADQKAEPAGRRSWVLVLRRIAAATAAVVVLFFVSFESAKAFRWTFLLKLLIPVAETFGIYSASHIDSSQNAEDHAASPNEDTQYDQVNYASLESMPVQKDGFRIIPAYVPDRFAFVQGAIYEDPDMSSAAVTYRCDDAFLSMKTMIFYNEDAIFSFEFERTLPEPRTETMNGYTITYYHNMDEERISASWIEGKAHYHIVGNITQDELAQMIGSMLE